MVRVLPEPIVTVQQVPWERAIARMDWRPGEHITLIGPAGVGKTELMIDLLSRRKFGIFLNTKRIDSTQDRLKSLGFRVTKDGNINHVASQRWMVSPPWNRKDFASTDSKHAVIFTRALTEAFWQTGWSVGIDELEFINRDLKITAPVDKLLRQGRSQHNSMILGTQRPRHVTLHAYEQATHMFIWKQRDASNAMRAAELAGINGDELVSAMPGLAKHDVLYVNNVTGEMFITNTRWKEAEK
jgi:hypothetical protein